jgi:RNA polymerase sigma factor (sigma-70 family)
MTAPTELIDQLAALHEDAFGWAVTCSGGDGEAGADALQEAYLKVAAGSATFAGRSSLKTWWLAVVRLTAFERQRGRRRWQRIADSFHEWLATTDEAPEAPVGEDMAAPPDADRLSAALAQLPGRQAEVLHLVFQHDLSLSEAASVMGVSVGSARQHYDRAKKRLRSLLCAQTPATLCDHAR